MNELNKKNQKLEGLLIQRKLQFKQDLQDLDNQIIKNFCYITINENQSSCESCEQLAIQSDLLNEQVILINDKLKDLDNQKQTLDSQPLRNQVFQQLLRKIHTQKILSEQVNNQIKTLYSTLTIATQQLIFKKDTLNQQKMKMKNQEKILLVRAKYPAIQTQLLHQINHHRQVISTYKNKIIHELESSKK